jgi:hypothetical protein
MSEEENRDVRVLRQSESEFRPGQEPIVLEYKKWKKKTRNKAKDRQPKYSSGLKDIQRLEGDVVHVSQTAARALSKSIDTYEEERKQSAKKKRDGAIEDFIHTSAKATSTYLKESSDIPIDLADSVTRLSLRKKLRKGLRRASKRVMKWPM